MSMLFQDSRLLLCIFERLTLYRLYIIADFLHLAHINRQSLKLQSILISVSAIFHLKYHASLVDQGAFNALYPFFIW